MQKQTYNRCYNFCAGPAMLPEEVLEQIRVDIFNYRESGLGVMELSHRGTLFDEIIKDAEKLLREIANIGENYHVLFLTGGGTNQFSMVPMNLLPTGKTADYILSGIWAEKAYQEATRFGNIHIAANSQDDKYRYIPKTINLSKSPAYLHYTSNNTLVGTQLSEPPECGDVPLVCDASSDFLHKPIDINKFALIYAGAQKNMGIAGTTIVIIRKDLLERVPKNLPLMMDYRVQAEERSLYNTPPTFPIYVVREMLKWLKKHGGPEAAYERNRKKAALVYDALDSNPLYATYAKSKEDRSLMNITFRLPTPEQDEAFIIEAKKRGLLEIKGHRLVGGIRASMYNAFPTSGAEALAKLIRDFS